MTTEDLCMSILKRACIYAIPPFVYVGGHSFCPDITEAIRVAYIGGYRAGKAGEEPEVGVIND